MPIVMTRIFAMSKLTKASGYRAPNEIDPRGRYSDNKPMVEDDMRSEYEAFLDGGQLPGRENG